MLPSFISKSFNLKSEIERLETLFKNIVQSLKDHLKEKKVSVMKLQKEIKSIPLSLQFRLGQYYRDQTSRIFRTKSIFELLECLWDYLNPGLLDYFVTKFGSKDNKRSMKNCLKELKKFRMAVKIGEYLRVIPRQEDVCSRQFSTRITTEMRMDWEKNTLQDVEEYKNELSKELYIQIFLPRVHVIRSSIAIVFSIQNGMKINFVKLEPFFLRKGVIKVYLNDYCIIDWTKEVSG